MAAEYTRIILHEEGDYHVVRFADQNILEETVIHQIGQEFNDLIAKHPQLKLLVSFAGVEHLSSAALGMLITLSTKVKESHGQLKLSSIQPSVFEIFQITKLSRLFEIYEAENEAISSFTS